MLYPFSVEPPIPEECYWEAIASAGLDVYGEISIRNIGLSIIILAFYDPILNNISQVESDLTSGLVALGYTNAVVEFIPTSPTVATVRVYNEDMTGFILELMSDTSYQGSFENTCVEPNLELLEDGLPALLEDGDYSLLET